jgi:protein ImuB
VPAERVLCLWCPDWPVVAARTTRPEWRTAPLAVVARTGGRTCVVAASAEARAEGVVPGLRRREAEARCPGLVVRDADPGAEARAFEAVARAVETVTPRMVLERPGRLGFPTRGPSRYFGGDAALAERVGGLIAAAGVPDARVGVADGGFAARLAARVAAPGGAHLVGPGGSPAFLADWPVTVLDVPDLPGLPDLLGRLGLRTLGAFAALPAPAVLARFGAVGARAHRDASGTEDHATALAPVPPDLVETAELDPPATRVDEAAFVAKGLADRLLGRLESLGLSCAQVAVEIETADGEHLVRHWRHDGGCTPAALVGRVRWQLEGWITGRAEIGEEAFVAGGITVLRLRPEQVAPATGRQLGLWGGDAGARDRADRALARVQGLLGHDAVVTACPGGGRTPAERVRWIPWGDARPAPDPGPPWPGTVPGPAPARVFVPGVPAELHDPAGRPVAVTGRGEATGRPGWLACPVLPGGGGPVRDWAGPWIHDVRWWDRTGRRRRALWHVVVADPAAASDVASHAASDAASDAASHAAVACLVGIEGGRVVVEALYD